MSILYSSNFNHPDGKLGSNQEDLELNYNRHYHHQPLDNSGLLRYHSAPSSFFSGLVNGRGSPTSGGGIGQGVGGEDYCYFGSSNSNADTSLPRFIPTYSGSGDSNSHHLREFGESAVVKQEALDLEIAYPNLLGHDVANDNLMRIGSMDGRFSVVALENSAESMKVSPANASNLIRQFSSPARTFSDLNFDDGFGIVRDFDSLKSCGSANGELSQATSMLRNQVNFSSSPRLLPQITEIGCNKHDSSSPDNRISKRQFLPCFENDNWGDSSLDDLKLRYPDRRFSSGLNPIDNQNRNPETGVTSLTHHLSLPKTVAEMATIEKLAQFQGTAQCKFRAKRGFATHPRSIAERVRRTRISERMKKLQDLFPNMDKQTNTADMLDLAIEYIKDLQKQVKTLKESKAMCMCSSKRKQY